MCFHKVTASRSQHPGKETDHYQHPRGFLSAPSQGNHSSGPLTLQMIFTSFFKCLFKRNNIEQWFSNFLTQNPFTHLKIEDPKVLLSMGYSY